MDVDQVEDHHVFVRWEYFEDSVALALCWGVTALIEATNVNKYRLYGSRHFPEGGVNCGCCHNSGTT